MYLSSTKQIVQTLSANEEYDKNLTSRLNEAAEKLENLEVQMRYTSLSLLDIQSLTEGLNGSFVKHIEEKINGVYEKLTNSSKRVAFTAGVTSASYSWSSGTLMYYKVINNVGGGYNPNTGIFTAPVGDYVFYVSIQGYDTNNIYIDIVLNGSSKVRAVAYSNSRDQYDVGTNFVTLRLRKGDTVWVRHYRGTGYWTDSDAPRTTFS
ncbi:complement C1q-like protein 2 [Saccostrea cucullata]|uniref:complement C1q-like protein 2 n=1 Tax=Saccostrea cuccullata TaxID=36930 RepID=UPI002ED00D13